jgi:NDP-sugar pyrophosphorylase family protein
VYGDVLTDLDLGSMVRFHAGVGAMATIAVQLVEDVAGKGVVRVDGGGRIHSFVEKPTSSPRSRCLINTGVYVLEPEMLAYIQPGYSDFGIDVFPALVERALPIYAWRLRPWEYLIDIGTREAYERANEDVAKGKVSVAPSCVPR